MKPTRNERLLCCNVIQGVYAAFEGWEYQGRPREDEFHWPELMIWGESRSYERRPGPRDRYHWVSEWAPMAKVTLFDRTLFVAFRGTRTQHEWSNNFRFPQRRMILDARGVELDYRTIHDGFADTFESMLPDIVEQVESFWGKMDRIIVTGHSLGGALATLTVPALDSLLRRLPGSLGVVMGSPRVGSTRFAEFFAKVVEDGTFYRYEIEGDPVVDVPRRQAILWEYRHVGIMLPLTMAPGWVGMSMELHALKTYRELIATEQE